jgi:hypothetical protein
MKRKELLILTTVIAATMPGINAADGTTEYPQHDIQKKAMGKFVSGRDEIITKLLSEFRSALEIRRSDLKYDLEAISKYYNTGYNFGDESSNGTSLYNWIVYTRSLYALQRLGHSEYGSKLQEELGRARRRLETIDFYIDDKDYGYCLSGIWSIVAIFDTQEREKFLRAIDAGKEIPMSQDIIKMINDYKFDYK